MLHDTPEGPIGGRTRTFIVWKDGPILRGRLVADAVVTLDDAREGVAMSARILNGGPGCPLLIDIRFVRSVSADARAYLAGPEAGRYANALGVLMGSPLSRVLGNVFIGIHRPVVPTRLFTDEREAERWLLELVARKREAA